MSEVGLRELRQQASDLVRRAESEEEVTLTMSGRPAARLVAAAPPSWQSWEDVARLFAGPGDSEWEHDRALLDQELRDPWTKY